MTTALPRISTQSQGTISSREVNAVGAGSSAAAGPEDAVLVVSTATAPAASARAFAAAAALALSLLALVRFLKDSDMISPGKSSFVVTTFQALHLHNK